MSIVKKQKIDWCGNVMNEIDIASEKILLEFSDSENITKSVNRIREVLLDKVKEIECFNSSNEMKKYAYFVAVDNILIDSSFGGYETIDNLLGNLVILNQDYSHLFKNLQHKMDLRNPENLSIMEDYIQSEILEHLMRTKNENNIIIDLSKPSENIIESIEFICRTIENNDCVSALVNLNKIFMLTVDVGHTSTITDEFFSIFNVLRKLIIYPNNLTVIKKENFSNLKNLTHLIIDKCKYHFNKSQDDILTIEKNAFVGLRNLKTLILEKNGIKEIHKEMFNDLENLVTLSFAENCIRIVEKDTFMNLKNLQNLNLSENMIEKLENGCLNGLDKLVAIKLKDQLNYQMIIETNVFDSCPNLECLNIYGCSIDNLNELLFKHAVNMKVLAICGQDLDHNSNFIYQFTNLKSIVVKRFDSNHSLNSNCFNQLNTIVLDFYTFQKFVKKNFNIKALNIIVSIVDIFDPELFDNFENLEYFKLCESSEAYYKKDLDFSSHSIEFLMDELKFEI
ncbi:unnamed protein product [Brachionus calyciflorus]|uniref:Uncharacterized protein n=1 Tax=Brachionus calyciflorus TaxID=104777 RepID=A0A814HVR9_9BILA|nr:unnamed protein product [Brachionus calyciflorus]